MTPALILALDSFTEVLRAGLLYAQSNPLEALAVVTGVFYVWLMTRESIWCWPVGIVSGLVSLVVYFNGRLYGWTGLQVIYLGQAVYGWYAWLHGGADHSELRVSRSSPTLLVALAAAGTVVALLAGLALHHWTDEAQPWPDAFTTVFGLIAQWMQTRKRFENWYIWVGVNVTSVTMMLLQGMLALACLYSVFLVLAFVGLRDWRRSMRSAGGPA
jgi:nicotinamide mononucleotide transporter